MLTNHDLVQLTKFRRELHQYPELSGKEIKTAKDFIRFKRYEAFKNYR